MKCKGQNSIQVVWRNLELQYKKSIKEIFTDLYLRENKSYREIAKFLSINERSVKKALLEFNIPIRYGSDAVKSQWIGNTKRRKNIGKLFSEWQKENPEEAGKNRIKARIASLNNKGMTNIEKAMANAFADFGLNYEFEYPVGNKFHCDFAFPDKKVIVECDGEYWHSSPHRKRLDYSKDKYLQKCGYTVIRLKEKDILQNAASCAEKVLALL